jgi:hypothetical protein
MANDVDTLATALYATIDDMMKERPDPVPACKRTNVQHP